MIIALYIAAAIIMAVGSLYFAWRSRDFRKFLAGAFFVSSGILFSLSRRCFGASVGDRFCRNTPDQRCLLHRPFHLLLALFILWLQEASPTHAFRQIICQSSVRVRTHRSGLIGAV
jgi:membrane associated rhomboid family serine protease